MKEERNKRSETSMGRSRKGMGRFSRGGRWRSRNKKLARRMRRIHKQECICPICIGNMHDPQCWHGSGITHEQ